MSNEKLTIQKDKARLTVIGRSYPDENTDSGTGIDLTQELIDILEDLDIDLPPIDFDDWDDIPVIIGYDDEGHPLIIYPDPETDEIIEWPIDFPIEEIDWPDVDITPDWIDNQPVIIIETDGEDPIIWPIELPDGIDPEDWTDFDITPIVGPGGELDIVFEDPDTGIDYNIDVGDLDIDGLSDLYDLDWMLDMDITGLDGLTGLNIDVSLDTDFNINKDELPTGLVIVSPPVKMEYRSGSRIDLTGMIIKAVKADGSTWTNEKYPNGHIPLGELRIDPLVATVEEAIKRRIYPSLNVLSADGYNTVHRNAWNTQYYNSALQIGVVPSGWSGWPAGSPLYAGSSSPFSSTIVLTAYQGHWYAMAYPSPVGSFMILCPAVHGYHGTVPLNWADFGSISWAGNMIPESSENPLGAEYYEALCQEITVTWARYGDRKELTAGFTIQVEPRAGGNGGR